MWSKIAYVSTWERLDRTTGKISIRCIPSLGEGYAQMQTVDRHVAFQDSNATRIELSLISHPPSLIRNSESVLIPHSYSCCTTPPRSPVGVKAVHTCKAQFGPRLRQSHRLFSCMNVQCSSPHWARLHLPCRTAIIHNAHPLSSETGSCKFLNFLLNFTA